LQMLAVGIGREVAVATTTLAEWDVEVEMHRNSVCAYDCT
jgi:hypothetical protein